MTAGQVTELVRQYCSQLPARHGLHQWQTDQHLVAMPAKDAQAWDLHNRSIEIICDEYMMESSSDLQFVKKGIKQLEDFRCVVKRDFPALGRLDLHPHRPHD
jgi:hypothetical protein